MDRGFFRYMEHLSGRKKVAVSRNVEKFPPKVNGFQLSISGNNQLYLSIEIQEMLKGSGPPVEDAAVRCHSSWLFS